MHYSTKKILILFVGLGVILVSTIAFAFAPSQETNLGSASGQQEDLAHMLRIQAIQQLINSGFDRFVTMPFGPGNDNLHLSGAQTYPLYPDYYVNTGITIQDDLDVVLDRKIKELADKRPYFSSLEEFSIDNLILNEEEIKGLKSVYLFRNDKDLKDLGYVVSSYRTRTNSDEIGRRSNIMISYRNIGNIRVLNPDQELSFMDEIHYDPNLYPRKRDLASGRANMGGIVRVKGGGICGGARGVNATIISNKAIGITLRYNHTRTYKNLYKNDINGQEMWIPGLDIAVYAMPGSKKDFIFKNIRSYPIILVLNFDGVSGSQEEGFVLSHVEDRGELVFKGREKNCFFWEKNGEPFKSCYGSVLWNTEKTVEG